jgi:ssDNA-binding Zn-finger/Zn-ribbon topoisomerase 1
MYAGRQFYGCKRYPTCKEIVNIEQVVETEETSLSSVDIPVEVRAAPRDKESQSKFFQVCALPASLVTAAHYAE